MSGFTDQYHEEMAQDVFESIFSILEDIQCRESGFYAPAVATKLLDCQAVSGCTREEAAITQVDELMDFLVELKVCLQAK